MNIFWAALFVLCAVGFVVLRRIERAKSLREYNDLLGKAQHIEERMDAIDKKRKAQAKLLEQFGYDMTHMQQVGTVKDLEMLIRQHVPLGIMIEVRAWGHEDHKEIHTFPGGKP